MEEQKNTIEKQMPQQEVSRTHKPWELNEAKLHHRHAPTLSKATHGFMWKLAHLYWPIFVHFMTDKYAGRLHHLVVDIIYAVVSLVLLFANIGLAVWFYLYFSPAEIELRLQAPSVVRSGQDMLVSADYVVGGRDIDNVSIDFILPEGFFYEEDAEKAPYTLGDLDEGDAGQVFAKGQVFGSVGTTYDVLAVVRYESYGRQYSQVQGLEFTVNVASFEMDLQLPDTVTYNVPIEGTISFKNASSVDRTNVRLVLDIPDAFRVSAVRFGDQSVLYDAQTREILLPAVAAGESGELLIRGRFVRGVEELVGDMHQEFAVSAVTSLDTPIGIVDEEFKTGASGTAFDVVVPRVTVTSTATEAVQFGDTITGVIVVRNVGDEAVESISLNAVVSGSPVSATNMRIVRRADEAVVLRPTVVGETATFENVVDRVNSGESVTLVYTLPTASVTGQQVSSSIQFSGSAYVPVVDARIPVVGSRVETRYNSVVNLDARTLYYGPNGEQLGFGPYPAQAWDYTGLRVLLRVTNANNPLSNVRLTAQLPSQVEWTDSFSVSAGTTMSFDEATRTVTWIVPTLAPSDTGYGAQFEVMLYPNHMQVGLRPHVADSIQITATDAFTGASITQLEGSVQIADPIVE